MRDVFSLFPTLICVCVMLCADLNGDISAEEIELALKVELCPTSSKVEQYHRQDWTSFFLSLHDLKLKCGAITQDEYDRAYEGYLHFVKINTQFVENLKDFEEQEGLIYLMDANADSIINNYESIYAVCVAGEWYAFDTVDSKEAILNKRNTNTFPVAKFYECIKNIRSAEPAD